MRPIKIIPFAATAILIAGGLSSCKPTENNYQKAYDAAKAKREAASVEKDFDISRMISEDAPRREKAGSDSAFVRRETLNIYGEKPQQYRLCNVALAKFKMRSNAQAMAARLRSEMNLDAFILEDRKEELYVIGASLPNLVEAIKWMREFASAHPDFVYVGLPEEPVIEIPLGKR